MFACFCFAYGHNKRTRSYILSTVRVSFSNHVIAEVKVSFLLIRPLKRLVKKRKYKNIFFIKNVFGGRIRTLTGFELLPTKNITF